jgi:hypothetical protein
MGELVFGIVLMVVGVAMYIFSGYMRDKQRR